MKVGEIWICRKSVACVIQEENYKHKLIDGRPDRFLVNVGEKVLIKEFKTGSDSLFWVFFETIKDPILLSTSSWRFNNHFEKVY